MSIIIQRGGEAVSLLQDIDFEKKWDVLYKNCRWATPYQSYNFVSTWYEAYQLLYTPLLVLQYAEQNKLTGLLPLAIHKNNGFFEIAGAHQAEYQAWLADTSCEETFIQGALHMIFENFSLSGLRFKYVLESVPLHWLRSKAWSKCCFIKSTKRPLINLAEDTFSLKSIANKTFRRYLNHLKRQGEVTYSQIKDRDVFLKVLPDLEDMYDFRMLTTYGVAPFSSDKFKQPFHLAMFDKKNLLHVSVLQVEDQIVAYELSIKDEKTLYSSVASFSPLFARLSPAKLHLFYLFQDLIQNNLSYYDLTPGRDPWKYRVANELETVIEISIFNSSFRKNLVRLQSSFKEQILQILIKLGVKPRNLWIIARSFGNNFVKGILFDFFKMILPEVNVLYRVDREQAKHLPECNRLSKNNLEDFLRPHLTIPGGLFNNFLANSQKNFHAGQQPFTATSKEKNFFCGWLTESLNPKHLLTTLPESLAHKKVAVIRDITATGAKMSVDFIERALAQMIREAALLPEIEEVIIIVPKRTSNLHEAIDKLNKRHSDLLKVLTN